MRKLPIAPKARAGPDATAYEGEVSVAGTTDAIFVVNLSHASVDPVTVSYSTQDGTATAPDDYQSTTGTLTFSPGETSKQIAVPIEDDDTPEDIEIFSIILGAAITDFVADGRIEDRVRIQSRRTNGNPFPTESYLTINPQEHIETGSTFQFQIKSLPAVPGNIYAHVRSLGPGLVVVSPPFPGHTFVYSFATPGNYDVQFYRSLDGDTFLSEPNEPHWESSPFHVQDVTTLNIKVRYSTALIGTNSGQFVTAVALENDIRDKFKDVSDRVIMKNAAMDFRAVMRFNVEEFTSFVPASSKDADDSAERAQLFSSAGAFTFTLVHTLGQSPVDEAELAGLTESGIPVYGTHVLIGWKANGKIVALIHEYLHTKGFFHNNSVVQGVFYNDDQKFIMHSDYYNMANRLEFDEADALD